MIRALFAAFVLLAVAAGSAQAQRAFSCGDEGARPAAGQGAVICGLDKVTGHAREYTLRLNRGARIGTLEVVARACDKAAPEETPEVRIYVEVFDHPSPREGQAAERIEIFHGWLFASSPGLSAVDHPTYDLWAVDCRS